MIDDDEKRRQMHDLMKKEMEPFLEALAKYGEAYPGAINDGLNIQRQLKAHREAEE